VSAHALIEVEVRPLDGCTIHHVSDEVWDVYRNEHPRDLVTLTVEDIAWVLDNPDAAEQGARGYGVLWEVRSMVGLRFVVVSG
jgi:hypothetical protein